VDGKNVKPAVAGGAPQKIPRKPFAGKQGPDQPVVGIRRGTSVVRVDENPECVFRRIPVQLSARQISARQIVRHPALSA